MTGFEVWLYFVVLPGIDNLAFPLAIFLGLVVVVIGVVLSIFCCTEDMEPQVVVTTKSYIKMCCFSMLLCAILAAIIPSEKQMAAIMLVPAVSNSERLQGIGDKTLDTLNGLLDQWLKEVAPRGQSRKKDMTTQA